MSQMQASAASWISSHDFQALRELGLLPAYAAQALPEYPADLPASVFADPWRKAYPCHTKMACYLSHVNWWADCSEHPECEPDPHIERRLEKFAEFWGIAGDVERGRRKWADCLRRSAFRTAEALQPQDCLLIWKSLDGDWRMDYPVRNPTECLKAAEWLLKHRDEFRFPERWSMAERLLEKFQRFPQAAAQLNAEQVEALRKQAGFGYPDPPVLASDLWKRAARLDRLEGYRGLAEPLRDLARNLTKRASLYRRQDWLTLAAAIDHVDRCGGWISAYGQQLQRPEDLCFALDPDLTRNYLKQAVALSTGELYGPEALEQLRPDDLLAISGPEQLKSLRSDPEAVRFDRNKVASFLENMDELSARFISDRLQLRGCQPVWTVSVPVKQQLPASDWNQAQRLWKQLAG